jgi:hypothetical protein
VRGEEGLASVCACSNKPLFLLPKDLEKDSALQAHAKIADPSKVRTGPEISETRDKTTPDHKLADTVDNIALKRTISALRKHSQECLLQRDLLLDEKNSLIAERDGLNRRTLEYQARITSIEKSLCWHLTWPTMASRMCQTAKRRVNQKLTTTATHPIAWRFQYQAVPGS